MKQNKQPMSQIKGRIDWSTVIIPFLSILALCLCFILAPETSKQVLGQIRTLFGDTFGLFYLIVGLVQIRHHPSGKTGRKAEIQ